MVEKHPPFRISLHYSGSLLEWLEENQKDFYPSEGAVERGQVELLAGGFYEPMIPLFPKEARRANFTPHPVSDEKLNASPAGLLASRKSLEYDLTQALGPPGCSYTIVDDSLFRYAGFRGR